MKLNKRDVVEGALILGEFGVDICAGVVIGALAQALVPPTAKPIVKGVMWVGMMGLDAGVAYGVDALRMDISDSIDKATEAIKRGKEIKRLKKLIEEFRKGNEILKEEIEEVKRELREQLGEEEYEKLMKIIERA